MRLVQIVPELPPAVGGVGDYACLLAQGLQQLGIDTYFLLAERPGAPAARPACETADRVSPVLPRASALVRSLDALRPDAVLLHYSGYGYARRGAPVWLARGVRQWKAGRSGCRLVVMFHEVYSAGGVPWSSSFWLGPARRRIAQVLARLADVCVTSCTHYARLLRPWRAGSDGILVLPVLSNVGEPGGIRPFLEREPVAVVFGQPRRRLDVYRRIDAFLPLLRRAGVRAIEDIGSRPEGRLPLPVRVHGIAEPGRVSDLLSTSRFGLLHLPSQLLGKSGCFAAFAAHGTVCLLHQDGEAPADGLVEGRHFVGVPSPPSEALGEATLEAVSAGAFAWYSGHRAGDTAAHLSRAMFPCAC